MASNSPSSARRKQPLTRIISSANLPAEIATAPDPANKALRLIFMKKLLKWDDDGNETTIFLKFPEILLSALWCLTSPFIIGKKNRP